MMISRALRLVTQAARNLVMDLEDARCHARYLIRDLGRVTSGGARETERDKALLSNLRKAYIRCSPSEPVCSPGPCAGWNDSLRTTAPGHLLADSRSMEMAIDS
ncbi:hypothetical protein BOQ63_015065 [Streptomyces viridifaciens]|nr:hypothetical protein CP971_08185 [Streptomyces viridifaciens]UKZ05338.1 hypothetical protein BOQ63_015065 [Streptomyces viridifaciens]